MGVLIEKPGMLTTVQDSGRYGYQKSGISPTGAADRRSFRWANLLVGNDLDEAALEITIMGPTLTFTGDDLIAVAGAELSPVLNGTPVETGRALLVKAGDRLTFRGPKKGCRAYIAFRRGLDVPVLLGSRSTHLKGGFGGYQGRALKSGDEIGSLRKDIPLPDPKGRYLPPVPLPGTNTEIRVIRGPQENSFTARGLATFLSSRYTVTPQGDRQGLRLDGPLIEQNGDGNIISDGIVFGSIQVPGNGKPIIMLADRQTTGGYPKIATVITADLPLLAQIMPGNGSVTFREVTLQEAQKLYREEEAGIRYLKRMLGAVPL